MSTVGQESAWYVQIMEDSTYTCIKQMGPFSESKAERVRDGASINLNHDRFSVVTSQKSKEVKA